MSRAINSNPMLSPPMSIPIPCTSDAAAGAGTPAPLHGCTGLVSKDSWAFNCAATPSPSTPTSPARGTVLKSPTATVQPPTKSPSKIHPELIKASKQSISTTPRAPTSSSPARTTAKPIASASNWENKTLMHLRHPYYLKEQVSCSPSLVGKGLGVRFSKTEFNLISRHHIHLTRWSAVNHRRSSVSGQLESAYPLAAFCAASSADRSPRQPFTLSAVVSSP